MIQRVKIRGYKSLVDLEVKLRPLSVIFGPNAAGKSNFLDALQLLSRLVTSRTLKEAFESPYRGTPLESFTFSAEGIEGHLKRDHLDFELEVDVELSESTVARVEREIREMRSGHGTDGGGRHLIRERLLRYRVCIEILPNSGILRVRDEYLAPLRIDGEVKTSRSAFIETSGQKLHLRMEGQAHPTYHDLGLDHTLISRPLYPPHYPHVAAFKQELADWAFFYFEPRERMRAVTPVKEVRHIGLMGEDLAAFLNTLNVTAPKQFRAIERALHTLVPRVSHIQVSPNNLGEVELRLIEDNVAVPARLVSEGTLRLLGLLAVTSSTEPSTLIAFEEPENGVHPRRIGLIADFLKSQSSSGGRQFIVTTHSPILPDLLPDEALFVARRSGACTTITAFRDAGALFRKNEIDEALEDSEEVTTTVSERILRGDFDE